MCVCTPVDVLAQMYPYMCVDVCICMYMCASVYMCVYVRMCMYVCDMSVYVDGLGDTVWGAKIWEATVWEVTVTGLQSGDVVGATDLGGVQPLIGLEEK